MSAEGKRELEISEAMVSHLFSQIEVNQTEQEELNNILKEIDNIGEGEYLVHLVGAALIDERVPEAKMELSEKLKSLKENEKDLQRQLESEKQRCDRLRSSVHYAYLFEETTTK